MRYKHSTGGSFLASCTDTILILWPSANPKQVWILLPGHGYETKIGSLGQAKCYWNIPPLWPAIPQHASAASLWLGPEYCTWTERGRSRVDFQPFKLPKQNTCVIPSHWGLIWIPVIIRNECKRKLASHFFVMNLSYGVQQKQELIRFSPLIRRSFADHWEVLWNLWLECKGCCHEGG